MAHHWFNNENCAFTNTTSCFFVSWVADMLTFFFFILEICRVEIVHTAWFQPCVRNQLLDSDY